MDRGERRRRTEWAKRRRLVIVYNHATGPSYRTFERPLCGAGTPYDTMTWWLRDPEYYKRHFFEHPWRACSNIGRWMMRNPGRWEREMMIRPARSEQNQMLRRGDFNGVFPDYKKPVQYYY